MPTSQRRTRTREARKKKERKTTTGLFAIIARRLIRNRTIMIPKSVGSSILISSQTG